MRRKAAHPENWQPAHLEDLVFFQRGFDITKAEQRPGAIPVVSSSGIQSFHSEAKIKGPGVVIGRKGSLGTVHFVDCPYWPHDTTLWSKDFRGNDPRYVYYFLHTMDFERYDVGNSNPTLNRNHIHSLDILIPPLHIQKVIVDVLSAYDDLIENNRRRIQLLEQAARLLYKEWFVHLRFPGHEHTKIIDGVPEGWKAITIGELGEVITGKTPSKKQKENFGNDMPFIKIPDMHGSAIVVYTEESLSEEGAKTQSNKTLPPRSILVSCIGTVGAVAFNASPAQTNQQINSIVPASDLVTYWAYFMTKELKPLLEGMGGGATMANVNKSKFSGIKVIIPSKNLLKLFSDFTKSVFDQIEILTISNARLAKARDLLLPKLMNGEVVV